MPVKRGLERALGAGENWVSVPAAAFISCVVLVTPFHLFPPQVPYPYNRCHCVSVALTAP